MIRRVLFGAATGAVAIAVGCGVSSLPSSDPVGSAVTVAPPTPEPEPTEVSIPTIDVHSSLIPLGLLETGELQTPPVDQPMQAGWYAGADPVFDGDEVKPGERGSAVIAGHVDGAVDGRKGQPGIFYRLHQLAPGDTVHVARRDQSWLTFVVIEVQRYPKTAFDHTAVYRRDDKPRLNLVTCTGAFSAGHYEDNLVVFTEIVPGETP